MYIGSMYIALARVVDMSLSQGHGSRQTYRCRVCLSCRACRVSNVVALADLWLGRSITCLSREGGPQPQNAICWC